MPETARRALTEAAIVRVMREELDWPAERDLSRDVTDGDAAEAGSVFPSESPPPSAPKGLLPQGGHPVR